MALKKYEPANSLFVSQKNDERANVILDLIAHSEFSEREETIFYKNYTFLELATIVCFRSRNMRNSIFEAFKAFEHIRFVKFNDTV